MLVKRALTDHQVRHNRGSSWLPLPPGLTDCQPMGNQYRHGDVLIEQKKDLPPTREKLPHTILAHGEVTGHAHRVKESADADLYATSDGLYLHVRSEAATVVH